MSVDFPAPLAPDDRRPATRFNGQVDLAQDRRGTETLTQCARLDKRRRHRSARAAARADTESGAPHSLQKFPAAASTPHCGQKLDAHGGGGRSAGGAAADAGPDLTSRGRPADASGADAAAEVARRRSSATLAPSARAISPSCSAA